MVEARQFGGDETRPVYGHLGLGELVVKPAGSSAVSA